MDKHRIVEDSDLVDEELQAQREDAETQLVAETGWLRLCPPTPPRPLSSRSAEDVTQQPIPGKLPRWVEHPEEYPERMLQAERAVRLRMEGYTFAEIAKEIGVDRKHVRHFLYLALKERLAEPVDEFRELQLRRLERAIRAIYGRVLQGDLAAIGKFIDLIDVECRLLGLYHETKRVVWGVNENADDPLHRLLAAIAQRVEASHVGTPAVPPSREAAGDSPESGEVSGGLLRETVGEVADDGS